VLREDNQYIVRDAGSLNGTYLNRERVESAPLVNGDELQIGTFKLVFLTGRGDAT
jgi:pSer/pThr/pTyr-binding forkhead associated (FHA) protein